MIQRIKDGERINKTKPDGSEFAFTTFEEYLASNRANSKQWRRNLKAEDKAKINQRQRESASRMRTRQKAQREAEREGRSWQGSPLRKPGRPRKNWEQEQMGAQQVHQHAPVPAAMEEGQSTQHAPPGARGSRTLRLTTPESSLGSWTLPKESLPRAPHQRFAPGPSSPKLDLVLSLSALGSSTAGQRQADGAPRPAAPPSATTMEDDRLRLTLATPVHD